MNMKRFLVLAVLISLAACSPKNGNLPRGKASAQMDKAMSEYLQAVKDCAEDLHSIMVVQHGKVLAEHFFVPDTAHVLHSVSKTFTSTAVGFAISEGLLHLDDKIVVSPIVLLLNASALVVWVRLDKLIFILC